MDFHYADKRMSEEPVGVVKEGTEQLISIAGRTAANNAGSQEWRFYLTLSISQ